VEEAGKLTVVVEAGGYCQEAEEEAEGQGGRFEHGHGARRREERGGGLEDLAMGGASSDDDNLLSLYQGARAREVLDGGLGGGRALVNVRPCESAADADIVMQEIADIEPKEIVLG